MAGSNILIVEDEIVIALEIRATLTKLGYTVAGSAIQGKEAIQLAGEKKPDLVLMDIRLKGEMDGIEAAKKIMEEYNIPIIFLTGNSDKETLKRAVEIKPAGFLVKPFNGRELLANIEIAVHKKKISEPKISAASAVPIPERLSKIIPDDELEMMKVPCVAVDLKGNIQNMNKSAADLLPTKNKEEAAGRKFFDFIEGIKVNASASDRNFIFADKLKVNSAESKAEIRIEPGFVTDKNNVLTGFVFSVSETENSDEKQRTEKQIMDKKFLSLMDVIPEIVFVVDKNLVICHKNNKFMELSAKLGITNVQMNLPIVNIPELSGFVSAEDFRKVFNTKSSIHRNISADNNTHYYAELIPEIDNGNVNYVTAVISDITTIVKAQQHSSRIADTLNDAKEGIDRINMTVSDMKTPLNEVINISEKRPQPELQAVYAQSSSIADLLEHYSILMNKYEETLNKLIALGNEAASWKK